MQHNRHIQCNTTNATNVLDREQTILGGESARAACQAGCQHPSINHPPPLHTKVSPKPLYINNDNDNDNHTNTNISI